MTEYATGECRILRLCLLATPQAQGMVGGGADQAEGAAAQAGDAAQGAAADASNKAQGAAASAGEQAQGMAAEAGAALRGNVQSLSCCFVAFHASLSFQWVEL